MALKFGKLASAVALATLAIGSVQAKEGGDQYPNGAETWLAGALPPPGNYFLNYFGYYSGDLVDGGGKKVPGAGVDAWFNAFRFVQITEHKVFGGNWGWHVIVPVVHQDVALGAGSKSQFGLGDITVNPFVLSWHTKNWHWAAALDINLPVGAYKVGDGRQSIGANYWSVEPIFAVTYLGDTGWEVSAKFMYNIKASNKDFRPDVGAPKMKYESGDEFHMDYLVGKRFGPWGVGLSGYYLKQTTNDKLNGQTIGAGPGGIWSEGRKGEVFAIGPTVSYTTKGGVHFTGQWNRETSAENRFEGDKFILKLIMPL